MLIMPYKAMAAMALKKNNIHNINKETPLQVKS